MSKKSRKQRAKKAEFIGKVIGYIIVAILSPLWGSAKVIYFAYRELIFQGKLFKMKIIFYKEKRKIKKYALAVRLNLERIEEILKKGFKEKYKARGEEYVNNLSFVISRKTIIDGKLPERFQSFYENKKKICAIELKKALRKSDVKKLHLQNLLLQAYIFKSNKKISEKYFKKAKAIDRAAIRLTDNNAKKVYKELRQLKKSIRLKKEIEKAPKLDIKFEHIKILMMLASILFLITGVFYNHLYLGHFGIELSKFFNLDDYIATSIDKFYLTLTSMALGIAILLFFRPMGWREETERVAKEGTGIVRRLAKFDLIFDDFIYYLIVAAVCISLIFSFYFDIEGKYINLSILFVLLFTRLSIRIAMKYFRQPLQVYLVALIVFIFFASVWSSTMEERRKIERGDLSKSKKYTINFKSGFHFDDRQLILLASTNRYYFFYDKNIKKTYIIPAAYIISIESKINQ